MSKRSTLLSEKIHWTNVGLTLVHNLRRWPSIKPAVVERPMFAGIFSVKGKLDTAAVKIVPITLIVTEHANYVYRCSDNIQYVLLFLNHPNIQQTSGFNDVNVQSKHDSTLLLG